MAVPFTRDLSPMNPSDSQPPSPHQVRRQREEAARRQQLQLRQQMQNIEEQRMRAVHPPKKAAVPGSPVARPIPVSAPGSAPKEPAPATALPAAAPPKGIRPLGLRVSGWINAEKAAADLAPPPARTKVPPAAAMPLPPMPESNPVAAPTNLAPPAIAPHSEPGVVSPKVAPVVLKMKVASVDLPHPPEPEAGPEDVEGATQPVEPVFSGRILTTDLPASGIEETVEIEPSRFGIDLPELKLATEPPPAPVMTRSARAYQESIAALPVVLPAPTPASEEAGELDPLALNLAPLPDLFCPKCRALIPESHHGAFFTACPKCGEIVRMK